MFGNQMKRAMNIHRRIRAFHADLTADQHHRYRSWEHCYGFFRRITHKRIVRQHDDALQLGFYLASWGMYRGSSFLLQRAYTVHLSVVESLASPERRSGKMTLARKWNMPRLPRQLARQWKLLGRHTGRLDSRLTP